MLRRAAVTLVTLALLHTPAFAQTPASAKATADKRPVAVDDILNLKAVGSAMVSPDGVHVVYTVRQFEPASDREKERMESRTRIWHVPAAGGAARQITFGERGDTQPQWSPDGRYISFLSARGAGTGEDAPRAQIYVMRADGGEAWKLTDVKDGINGYSWSPDSRRIAYVTVDARSSAQEADIRKRDDERVFESDFRYSHIWTVAVESKETARVTEGTSWTVRGAPSWSPDSKRLTFAAGVTTMLRDYRTDVFIADTATKQVEKISTSSAGDSQPEWSPDGVSIAFVSEAPMGKPIADGTLPSSVVLSHLMIYDVARKTLNDVSTREFDLDVGSPRWAADSKSIVFTAGKRAYNEVFRFDVATGEYAQLTQQQTLQLGSRSRDGRVIALTMDSPTSPTEVYVADGNFANFKRLTDTNPQANNFALGETEVVTWKSTDGFEVEGVLLKPVGFEAGKRYPMLVVAHGGPSGAFVNNYRVGGLEGGQLWAGQGWAVLYPNPRGSTNYGEKFLQANINDWGGGDYRDIMSGVDAIIARGVADPNRLAHIGWSYGGYMTAWVITQTNRFKAAMVGAGLTNMVSMYGTNDIPNVITTYFGGIPGKETLPLYNARSAMTFIDNVTTPTLILHGANDERVPTGQAYELFRGLKDRGKTVELVFYPREGHGIAEYYHQKDRLARIQDWVMKYTAGDTRRTTTSQR
jgi:dipeptidyl aminopeptidase/acylaminoacyl peptidase